MMFLPSTCRRSASRRGFTLIELMVVVAIIGIVMTMALPAVYRQLHPDSMKKAVEEIMDACRHARAKAILQDITTELRIRPLERTFSVSGSKSGNQSTKGINVRLSDQILIEMLDVNFLDFREEESTYVVFRPNGTSDEFTLVLINDKDEWRMIHLEVVTGLAEVFNDPKDPRVTRIMNR